MFPTREQSLNTLEFKIPLIKDVIIRQVWPVGLIELVFNPIAEQITSPSGDAGLRRSTFSSSWGNEYQLHRLTIPHNLT